jgi:hypothetical protein
MSIGAIAIPNWIAIPVLLICLIVTDTVLAWGGSKFALITLAVTAALLVALYGYYLRLCRTTLDGWGETTAGWAAAQIWGMKTDSILREALTELAEFDEEAYVIYKGRASTATLEYLNVFLNEDAHTLAQALREEIG